MKNFITLLVFALISFNNVFCQTNIYNFKPNNGEILWQKVFETNLTFDELIKSIKSSGLIKNIEVDENMITGQTSNINANFKGAGYSEMSVPMYVSRNFFSFYTVINYKNGKYRVTLNRFLLTQKYNDGLNAEGEQTSLETYAIKKGKNEIKSSFLKKPAKILDFTLNQKFTFNSEQEDNNW